MAAGALIFNEKEELIIVEPSYKSDWEIPGGGIEKNESPQEALIREIKEELGVDLDAAQLLLIHYQKQEHDDVLFFIFSPFL